MHSIPKNNPSHETQSLHSAKSSPVRRRAFLLIAASALLGLAALSLPLQRASSARTTVVVPMKWVATWTSSMQGTLATAALPNPVAGTVANYVPFAFPNAGTTGANEQTLRMIVKPDVWGSQMRFKLSNVFGTQAVTFGHVTVGLVAYAGNVLPTTLTSVTFNSGSASVTIPAGQEIFSDAVNLTFIQTPDDALVQGRNLAVSMYVKGTSGPMTYHGNSFQTNYVTNSDGDRTNDVIDLAFPYRINSWIFITEVDVMAPTTTRVLSTFGSSSPDGFYSTLNGNDRYGNNMSRLLHTLYGNHVSVVNSGIGGDSATSPGLLAQTTQDRLQRDVIGVSGVTDVVLYVGGNDYGALARTSDQIIAGYQNIVSRLHTANIKVIGATLTSTKGDPSANYGTPFGLAQAAAVNAYIRATGSFDGVADFEKATTDPTTGQFLPAYQIHGDFSVGIDFLHTGPAGMQLEAESLNLSFFKP